MVHFRETFIDNPDCPSNGFQMRDKKNPEWFWSDFISMHSSNQNEASVKTQGGKIQPKLLWPYENPAKPTKIPALLTP